MGYARRALFGFGWMGSVKGLSKLLALAKMFLIARLLSPADIGLAGLAGVTLALTEVFTETGINAFLIQQKDRAADFIHTAWVVAIVRGAAICGLILLASPWISHFYQPELFPLLVAASVIPLVKGCINPAIIFFIKNMEYEKEARFRVGLLAIETVVSVALVVVMRSPMAVILGMVVSGIAEVVLSFAVIRPRPVFRFSLKKFREVMSFGKWMNASLVLNFLVKNADDLIIGKILGVGTLGYYQIAYKVGHGATGEVGDLASQTLLPIYARLKDDKKRLRRAFLRSLGGLAVFLIVPAAVLFSWPEELITLVLGEKWLPIIPVLPWLYVASSLYALNALTAPLFISLGYPKYGAFTLFFNLVVMVTALIPLSMSRGLVGVGIALLIARAAVQPLVLLFVLHLLFVQPSDVD